MITEKIDVLREKGRDDVLREKGRDGFIGGGGTRGGGRGKDERSVLKSGEHRVRGRRNSRRPKRLREEERDRFWRRGRTSFNALGGRGRTGKTNCFEGSFSRDCPCVCGSW